MNPDNTIIPPATVIEDDKGQVWTFSGVTSGKVLKNGSTVGDKVGVNIFWVNNLIFVLGNDDTWYWYDNVTDSWILAGGNQPSPKPVNLVIHSAYFFELQGYLNTYGNKIQLIFWDINNGGKYILIIDEI